MRGAMLDMCQQANATLLGPALSQARIVRAIHLAAQIVSWLALFLAVPCFMALSSCYASRIALRPHTMDAKLMTGWLASGASPKTGLRRDERQRSGTAAAD